MLGESDPTMSGAWAALIMAFAAFMTVLGNVVQSWWQRRVQKQDAAAKEKKDEAERNALVRKIDSTTKAAMDAAEKAAKEAEKVAKEAAEKAAKEAEKVAEKATEAAKETSDKIDKVHQQLNGAGIVGEVRNLMTGVMVELKNIMDIVTDHAVLDDQRFSDVHRRMDQGHIPPLNEPKKE